MKTRRYHPRHWAGSGCALWAAVLCLVLAAWAGGAGAQTPIPASTQFDITGFIQEAALTTAGDAHSGGTLMVNGQVVVVPRETIVILPANALSWQELFTQAPPPYGPTQTGMALKDTPAPLTTYEAHVVGNRVGDQYIAGLINIHQQSLNSGAGFINYIDYNLGEMRVGGVLGDQTTGTRVRINDSVGRFGRTTTSPDARFTVDDQNPTIAAATGFPMCLPRTDPAVADDPLCPQGNRPPAVPPATGFAAAIQMNDPGLAGNPKPDARLQAPFEVGDYVSFAGTLVRDCTDGAADCRNGGSTAGPWPAAGTAATWIAAHTIINNVAVYTWPGTNPAYVSIEVSLIGTGGLTVLGAGEAAIRTRFEGFTTDPTRNIHLYGVDLDPATGATSDRDFGTIGVDPGPPNGAVKGRWRFRPPCLPAGSVSTRPDKECIMNAAGTFLPPPREVRAVIEGLQTQVTTPVTTANGLIYGQYHAPIGEYIFPENIPGSPIVENNFNALDFLAKGGYTSTTGTLAGVLSPWPSNVVPSTACTPPIANAGGPYTAPAGGTITLAGSSTGTGPFTFAWAASAGTFSDPAIANPNYTAPTSGVVNLSLVVTNACGTSTATTTVTVNAPQAPTVNHVAPLSVLSQAAASFGVSGTDPAGLSLTFAVTQSGTPALLNLTVTSTGPSTATVSFVAPTLPFGQTLPSVVNLSIVATNTAGVPSAAEFTSVTINPLPDAVVITSAEYRTGKQRLIINATSSVVSPNVVLTLQPYVTVSGTTFTPTATLTNNGGGLYTLTLVGVPEPAVPPAAPLQVTSNLGGASPFTALTRIRN